MRYFAGQSIDGLFLCRARHLGQERGPDDLIGPGSSTCVRRPSGTSRTLTSILEMPAAARSSQVTTLKCQCIRPLIAPPVPAGHGATRPVPDGVPAGPSGNRGYIDSIDVLPGQRKSDGNTTTA